MCFVPDGGEQSGLSRQDACGVAHLLYGGGACLPLATESHSDDCALAAE
jgi:hypothetical protein